jgi:hypothetical protein
MKVQKHHLRIALRIALFVLVVAVLYNLSAYLRPAPRVLAPQPFQAPLIAASSGATGQIDPLSIRAPQDVDMARLPGFTRDPFLYGNESRQLVASAAVTVAGPDPMVRSILFTTTRRLAIVDGKIVGVGDQVGRYKVVEIEQGAVVFGLAGGERRRVSLRGASLAGLSR